MTPLLLPHLPTRSEVPHPRLIECLLEAPWRCRNEAIKMLEDFHIYGRDSRFYQPLISLPAFELKSTVRGGVAGGSRVYGFFGEEGAVLVNMECKDDSEANKALLSEVLECILAYQEGELEL